MKQLFFAGSFAVLALISYGVSANSNDFSGKNSTLAIQSINDTTPRLDTNSHKKKKYAGKDSLMKKDSTRPVKDTSK